MTSRLVIDLCGGTGSWSRPWVEAGYQVELVTLPMCDVRRYSEKMDTRRKAHMILAAPPCTHFSGSGAQYWPAKDRDGRTAEALSVVDACLDIIEDLDPTYWALENPVGRLRGLRERRLGEPKLIFNPCDYGDPYTKKTLVWGTFNLPKKSPVEPIKVCKQGSWLQRLGGSSERTKELRSVTPPGFASAFMEANRE